MRNIFLFFVMLGLAGCIASNREFTSEELLDADGKWPLVEVKQEEYDPQAAHMQARQQVNPTRTSRNATRAYTSHPGMKEMEENIHMRVLRIDTGQKLEPVGVAEKTLEQKPVTKFAGLSLPGRKPDRQKEAVSGRSATPVPARKPVAAELELSPKMVHATPKTSVKDNAGGARVLRLRIGNHPDKTRLVFDMDRAAEFRSALVENDSSLVLEIMKGAWASDAQKSFTNHPLVKNYSVRSDEKSVTFVIALKHPSKLVWSTMLPPNKTDADYRIVLDIKPL